MNRKMTRQQANELVKQSGWVTYLIAFTPSLIAGLLSGLGEIYGWVMLLSLLWALTYPFFVSTVFLRLSRGETYAFDTFIKQEFKENGERFILGNLLMSLYVLGWTLLFIIPGFIKTFSYILMPFLLKDQPELSADQAITKSRQLMHGNKANVFILYLSYYGWVVGLTMAFTALVSASIIMSFSSFAFGGGSVVGGAVLGLLSIASLIGSLVLSIRVAPRWHMALAVFYDEVK